MPLYATMLGYPGVQLLGYPDFYQNTFMIGFVIVCLYDVYVLSVGSGGQRTVFRGQFFISTLVWIKLGP